MSPLPTPSLRPVWREFSGRFADDRNCLASFLALESAEVLAGIKPANLINLADRNQPCGRNLCRLWRRHGDELAGEAGLATRVLAERHDSLLLLVYHPETLARLLERPTVGAFLRRLGYPRPHRPRAVLAALEARFRAAEFPHEVGVLLGYPLKDVAGFLGWGSLPFTCQGPWKIFGAPERSLELATAFRRSRCRMAGRLRCCTEALDCLRNPDVPTPAPPRPASPGPLPRIANPEPRKESTCAPCS